MSRTPPESLSLEAPPRALLAARLADLLELTKPRITLMVAVTESRHGSGPYAQTR